MSHHRSLRLRAFVNAVPSTHLERYFDGITGHPMPSPWSPFNFAILDYFLADPQNRETSVSIIEDFSRVNDICADGMNLVVRACHQAGLTIDPSCPAQELSFTLFLDHRDDFEAAWTQYLYFSSTAKLSFFSITAPHLHPTDDHVTRFRDAMQHLFANQAKGDVCHVHRSLDEGKLFLLVTRGTYRRTQAVWDGTEVTFTNFRPASEDLLVFDPAASLLQIHAALEKDRNEYLRAFCEFLLTDPQAFFTAKATPIFSLKPFQDGTFDYAGNGIITAVRLVKTRLKLDGPTSPEVELKSTHVPDSIRSELPCVSLACGEMTLARLRFDLAPPDAPPTTVTFDIEPPARSDLAQKKYAEVIEAYLSEQGVRLQ